MSWAGLSNEFIMQPTLKPYFYNKKENFIADLKGEVIDPAEERVERKLIGFLLLQEKVESYCD